jgi:hypothetical protein
VCQPLARGVGGASEQCRQGGGLYGALRQR